MLNNIKISKKLIAAFSVVVAGSAGASIIAYSELRQVKEEAARTAYSTNLALGLRDGYAAIVEQQAASRAFLITNDPSWLERYQEFGEAADQHFVDFRDNTASDELRAGAVTLIATVETWRREVDESIALGRNPATRDLAFRESVDARLAPVRDAAKQVIDRQLEFLESRAANQDAALTQAVTTLIIGGVASVLIATLMAWLLSTGIATPINAMQRAMRRLADGDNAIEVPGVGRKDEVGEMAEAVQTFKVAAIEKQRLEADAEEQRKAAEAERAQAAVRQVEAEEAQKQFVVTVFGEGFDNLARGNLTYRLTRDVPDAYAKLKADFNNSMDQLQAAMQTIAGNTSGIRTGAGEISQAADDLSRRTEQQAASLEETAAALDQITATVRKTADGANQANSVVIGTRSDAEASGEVVRETVDAMAEIERSAKQISQIIGVIDEIAFQTNLLALNAGVEAARAGDAGRGFAVVASEVRALAQRSSEAAKEIKGLISASSRHVELGVERVGEAGKALQVIVAKVAEISGLVGEIAASAQEQATALTQVNTAVNQMDQVTQQNAAMVEESTAASHSLTQEANALSELVSRFKIGAEAARAQPAPAKAAVAAVTSARADRAPRTSPVVAQQKRVAKFAAAHAAPKSGDGDWEEF